MSGCAVCLEDGSPAGGGGLIPEGFVAPQSKVSAFSFVAPRLVEEFLAALPARVFQQALRARFKFCFGPEPKPSRPRKSSRQVFGHCRKVYCRWVAGGGVKPGLACGGADDFSRNAVECPVPVRDLHATVLRLLGVSSGAGLAQREGREAEEDRFREGAGERDHDGQQADVQADSGGRNQMPAPWARSWRYSVRMDRTAITAASMRSGSGARPGVSKTISRARGRCSGGALRTPR